MVSESAEARVLLDQNAPRRLIARLANFDVVTARYMGWSELSNGDLIAAAESGGFDVLVTADRNLRHQQNSKGRRLAIVVLQSNRWTDVERNIPLIRHTLRQVRPGSLQELEFDETGATEPGGTP